MKLQVVIPNLALVLLLIAAAPVCGQKPEGVCEIVARVNDDVITSADYLAALREYRDELDHQLREGAKSGAEISAEFARLESTVLDAMIADLLLDQRAGELGLEADAEFNEDGKDPGIHPGYHDALTPAEFAAALRMRGLDPEEVHASQRKRILRALVLWKEVFAPVFASITDKDRRDYYKSHKEEFVIPSVVTISEIFLPFEGHTETGVEYRARKLLGELRAGADFARAVEENTPATRPSHAQGGKLGVYRLKELIESVATAISTLKPGEFTEPVRVDDGYMLIRLDERTPATLRRYDDPEVQQTIARAITMQRAESARKDYIARLRDKAYIEVCAQAYQRVIEHPMRPE